MILPLTFLGYFGLLWGVGTIVALVGKPDNAPSVAGVFLFFLGVLLILGDWILAGIAGNNWGGVPRSNATALYSTWFAMNKLQLLSS
jgi:hypothetical protein